MVKNTVLLVTLFFIISVKSQIGEGHLWQIRDSVLENRIAEYIEKESASDSMFGKGLGFVVLKKLPTVNGERRYGLNIQYATTPKEVVHAQPIVAYSTIKNRIILIHDESYARDFKIYWPKEKYRKFRKSMAKYLPKTRTLIVRDSTGKVMMKFKNFTDDAYHRLDGQLCLAIDSLGNVRTYEAGYRNCFDN